MWKCRKATVWIVCLKIAVQKMYIPDFRVKAKMENKEDREPFTDGKFSTVFYIWCHGKLDDREVQEQAYNKAETILTSVLKRFNMTAGTIKTISILTRYRPNLLYIWVRMPPMVMKLNLNSDCLPMSFFAEKSI